MMNKDTTPELNTQVGYVTEEKCFSLISNIISTVSESSLKSWVITLLNALFALFFGVAWGQLIYPFLKGEDIYFKTFLVEKGMKATLGEYSPYAPRIAGIILALLAVALLTQLLSIYRDLVADSGRRFQSAQLAKLLHPLFTFVGPSAIVFFTMRDFDGIIVYGSVFLICWIVYLFFAFFEIRVRRRRWR